MSGDDQKPRAGVKRHHTATDFGMPSRKAERARTNPMGHPVVTAEAVLVEVQRKQTGDLFPVETFDEQTGVTQRIQEDPDLLRLYTKIEHTREKSANQLLAAMGSKPPEVRMSALERTIRRVWRLALVALVPIGSVTLAAGHYLIDRTAKDERAAIEREQLLLHDIEHERRLRELEDLAHRSSQRIDDFTHGRATERDRDLKPDNVTPPRTP